MLAIKLHNWTFGYRRKIALRIELTPAILSLIVLLIESSNLWPTHSISDLHEAKSYGSPLNDVGNFLISSLRHRAPPRERRIF